MTHEPFDRIAEIELGDRAYDCAGEKVNDDWKERCLTAEAEVVRLQNALHRTPLANAVARSLESAEATIARVEALRPTDIYLPCEHKGDSACVQCRWHRAEVVADALDELLHPRTDVP